MGNYAIPKNSFWFFLVPQISAKDLAVYSAPKGKKIMHPIITIFCAFTRQWAVDGWLENLEAVRHDPALTNLCFIVDGDQHLILNTLKKFAEARGYRSFYYKINEEWHPNEVRLAIRRMRVADVKNQSKDLIARTDGDIIISFEDDTVFDRLESFDPLITPLLQDPKIGFVEGVQMGRWGAPIIGAWRCDNAANPKKVWTMLPPDEKQIPASYPSQALNGGGFYGYATRRAEYLNHEYYTSSAQPWGPDVNFGLWLSQRGFECLINWSVVFGHRDFNRVLYPDAPKTRLAQVIYTKNTDTGKWDRSDYERDKY